MGHYEIIGDEQDHLTVRRMTPAEHGRTAEGMLALVEAQFEMFLEDVENEDVEENALRLQTTQVMIARAQVHATLATAPDFYEAPPAKGEGEQYDGEDADPGDIATDDDDAPGRFL